MARAVAVVGSGYMGGGIAQVLALAGSRVALADVSAEVALRHHRRLIDECRDFVDEGLFPVGAAETLQQNLWAANSIEDAVRDAEFIEDAVSETIDVNHATLERISAAARQDAVIGSNTTTISIGALAVVVDRP